MEIKVNDYVRYKYENCIYIGKIKFISEVMNFEETLQLDIDNCIEEILKEDIIKSSPNIIDLIEVGDYVNGMEVTRIGGTRWDENDLHCYCEHNGDENWKQVMIPAKDIKSIVTKEMYSNVEYRVEIN